MRVYLSEHDSMNADKKRDKDIQESPLDQTRLRETEHLSVFEMFSPNKVLPEITRVVFFI